MTRPGVDDTGVEAADHMVPALTLCGGDATGELLWLDEPLSFWGGTALDTGVIVDAHHPQQGIALGGRVIVMSASRGSSSSSSVLAEQIRAGVAPAAILLTSRDAIIALGALAAAEVYGIRMPIVLLDADALARLPRRGSVRVNASGAAASVVTTGADVIYRAILRRSAAQDAQVYASSADPELESDAYALWAAHNARQNSSELD